MDPIKNTVAAGLPEIGGGVVHERREVDVSTAIRVIRARGRELCNDPAKAKGLGRYDDCKNPATFATTYMGDQLPAALAEARVARSSLGKIVVSQQHHEQALVVKFEADRKLNLLALVGAGALRLNAASFMWQATYDECQRFASAAHEQTDVDGIMYPSRLWPDSMCYAVFDRAIARVGLRAVSALPLNEDNDYLRLIDLGLFVINPSDPGEGV